MPVDIEAVLALLPEMFPGAQAIPLKNVRPDPENPGPPLTDQAIQELADNLAERGLVNAIKVWPDRANPLAEGVQLHPDNPRLRSDGQPWTVGDFKYVILAGERRYRAADRLQWPAIQGFILNPTAEEAVEINYLDNDVRDRGWWATYQSIENLIKANPYLTQRQVATKLKLDLPRVNRALRLLPLLNAEARELIVRNSNNSNKGIRGISEAAALQLVNLGPGPTLKPGVRKKNRG
jgi:ParB family chromosome partitioning protein